MKRSRAFILSELLMTMLLQAGFILTLFTAFYLMMNFYTKSQTILSARNHAESVIQMVDDKIRAAGLGLWQCSNSEEIRARLNKIPKLSTTDDEEGYKLPVAVFWADGKPDKVPDVSNLNSGAIMCGDTLVLLYAQREAHKEDDREEGDEKEIIMVFRKYEGGDFDWISEEKATATVALLDDGVDKQYFYKNSEFFVDVKNEEKVPENIRRWGVSESVGVPFFVEKIDSPSGKTFFCVKTCFYGTSDYPLLGKIELPNAGEIMYLKCVQMTVHSDKTTKKSLLTLRELEPDGKGWVALDAEDDDSQNRKVSEENILDIYMELDTSTNILTLCVLATGGYDAGVTNKRPEAWPNNANPIPSGKTHDNNITDAEAEKAWEESDFCHHTVYVSRASWKLNNLSHFKAASWN